MKTQYSNVLYSCFMNNNSTAWATAADVIVSVYLLFLSFIVWFNKPNRTSHIDNPFISWLL